ncbi:MAG: hypothetical protein ACTSRU_12815 [Candidatus Hodarchaeales archaeon]
MVKTRVKSKLGRLHRKWFSQMITGKGFSFGRTDIILVTVSETTGPMGGINSISETTSTIQGDFQPVTPDERNIIDLGIAQIGEALLFVAYDVVINPESQELEINSQRWRVKEKFEAPEVDGQLMHQGFILQKKPLT